MLSRPKQGKKYYDGAERNESLEPIIESSLYLQTSANLSYAAMVGFKSAEVRIEDTTFAVRYYPPTIVGHFTFASLIAS